MVFPERTTNFVRGQGFRNNNQVLKRFVANGQQQKALDYFGFEGKYINSDEQSSFWFNRETGENVINFRNGTFESYEALLSTYTKESFHKNRFEKSGVNGFAQGDTDLWQYGRDPEERLGVIHQYKNRGLYSKDTYNYYNTITTLENRMNNWYSYGIYNTPYNFTPFQKRWWHFIYKIPRKW